MTRVRIAVQAGRPMLVTLFVLILTCGAAQAQQAAFGIEQLPVVKHVLDNGMTFLFLRREGAPTVGFVTNFRAGTVDEWVGVSGIAHLFEHMLFKGTRTIGTTNYEGEQALFPIIDAVADSLAKEVAKGTLPEASIHKRLRARLQELEDSARVFVVSNELDRILAENGARNHNAATAHDLTTYFYALPSNRAQLWFVVERDRLTNPVLREFYSEREVVREERRLRVENRPDGVLYEELLLAAYRVHPYRLPVAGLGSVLANITRSAAREYFQRFYGPSNAVVAIVGDIVVDSMRTWADRYFADVPPGERRRPILAREPQQRGERRIEVEFDANPQVLIAYHVPEASHRDAPSLEVLSLILTGGRSSRLVRRPVIREGLATSVAAFMVPGGLYPRLLVFWASPATPYTTREIETAIYGELDRLRSAPPSDMELRRVRNQAEANSIEELQDNLGLAAVLSGDEAIFNDWREGFRVRAAVATVTAADVRRVARAYFHESNRTVATLTRPEKAAASNNP